MSLDGREQNAQWIPNPAQAGNPYAGQNYYPYKPIILLHMTVSMGLSAGYISTMTIPPHDWFNPYNGNHFQSIEYDRAAKALYQPQFGYHWTNKHDYLLQTELVGIPVVNQRTYTDDQCRAIGQQVIAPKIRWLRARGMDIDLTQVRTHTNSSGSASEFWSGRMSEQEMADFNGVMAHIDCWGNDHWDCSVENILLMVQTAIAELGDNPLVPTPPPTNVNKEMEEMYRYVIDENGTAYACFGTKASPIGNSYAVTVMQKAGTLMTKEQMIAAGFEWNIDKASMFAAFEIQTVTTNVADTNF